MRPEKLSWLLLFFVSLCLSVGDRSLPFTIQKEGNVALQQTEDRAREQRNKAMQDWQEFQKFAASHEDDKSLEEVYASCSRLGLDERYHHHKHIDTSRKTAAGPKRLLFLTTVQALFFMTDRWQFHMYLGLSRMQQQYHTIFWGIGIHGFNVNETLRDNLARWFVDPEMDLVVTTWNFHRSYQGVESWKDWKFTSMYADLSKGGQKRIQQQQQSKKHKDSFVFEDVSQLLRKRRALEFNSYDAGTKQLTALLPGAPIIVLFVNEIEAKDERDISEIRPHIIFIQVEQQLGALSEVDVCGFKREPGSCNMHAFLKIYQADSPHAMFAYMPQGVHPPLFTKQLGVRDLVDSCDRASKRDDILIVGALNHRLYPLRTAAVTVKKAYTKVLSHYPHPGYHEEKEWHSNLEGMCRAFAKDTQSQQRNYIRRMKTSRLCLIGSRSFNLGYERTCTEVSWTLRKYVEALGAGCVVIGDLPSDYSLARYIPVRLTSQLTVELSWSVEAALEQYHQQKDKYNALCREGRRTVLENYTFDAVLSKYFAPAVNAYSDPMRKQRGVFKDTQSRFFVRGNDDVCQGGVAVGNRSVALVAF